MRYTQEEKGITLIALVVTIIIMLILTAVTFSATIGENGLIENAMNARAEESKKEALDEVISGIKRLEYYEQASSDRGVLVVNIYTIANLQKYLDGRVNGIRTVGSGKLIRITAVYYTNRNGSYTIFFDENGGTRVEAGFVVEKGQENDTENNLENIFNVGVGETISLAYLSEDDVSWGVPEEYKDIIQINETTGVVIRKQEGNAQVYGILKDESYITVNIEDKITAEDIEKNSIYVFYYDDINTLVFNNKNEGLPGKQVTAGWTNVDDITKFEKFTNVNHAPWYDYNSEIQTITFLDKIKPKNTAYWFYYLRNLSNINNIENFDTSNVTNMTKMFQSCSKLTNLDLSSFDTSNVTNMSYMFYGCSQLTNLDLSGFNTSNVKDMSRIFQHCSKLTNLNISGFDTSNVNDMFCMFSNCSQLTNLDLSSFDTSKVTDMGSMFSNCSQLTNLDLSSFNTSNVTNMGSMFSNCSKLTNLNLTSFNTRKVGNMTRMFYNCINCQYILVRHSYWYTSVVHNDMFTNCGSQVGGTSDVTYSDTLDENPRIPIETPEIPIV